MPAGTRRTRVPKVSLTQGDKYRSNFYLLVHFLRVYKTFIPVGRYLRLMDDNGDPVLYKTMQNLRIFYWVGRLEYQT